MKRTNMKKIFQITSIFSILLMFISCENLIARNNSEDNTTETVQTSQQDKTYLTIHLAKKNLGRTVFPEVISASRLSDFTLVGKLEGESSSRNLTEEPISSFEALSTRQFEILPGKWEFTLSAKYPSTSSTIIYADTIQTTINRGNANSVSFNLKPQGDEGGFKLTMNLTGTNVGRVRATTTLLSQAAGTPDFPDISDEANVVYSKEGLSAGTYHVLIEFFTCVEDETPFNIWESYVRVLPPFITEANVSLDFNRIYTITYKNAEGGAITFNSDDFEGGVTASKYSARSSFDLPVYKTSAITNGKIFTGWKISGSDTVITRISKGIRDDLVLTPNFVDPVLYVSASGVDSNDGFSSSTSLKTITEACNQISKYGYTGLDWKIMISGETTGIPKGSGRFPAYGPLEIPSDITNEMAKSILITGATSHGNWLEGSVPDDLDSINRGSDGAYNGSATSSALVISTEVPVTITNLKITGGNTGNGGAILINEGATVSLGDGNLLTGNRASKGGAICNKGTLFIYGSTIIGNKDATTYANYSSTQDLADNQAANYAGSGGGIYNGDPSASIYANTSIVARLYLGYKPSETDLTPVEEEFTGGIYFNGASSGGGIRNAIKSEVYMKSGTIQYNGISGNGAGIYNDDGGIVYMSGGSIANNRATYQSSIVNGGGVYNDWWRSKFIMSGGSIYDNIAWSNAGGTTNGKGGGVFNGGVMFMYGTAVIGDSSSNSPADSANHSNKANLGGGIYNGDHSGDRPGKLYIGYEPDSEFTPVPSKLEGGIFYNYSEQVYSLDNKWGGGGIFNNANSGYGEFRMSSGTIAYNATNDYGGGLWNEIGSLCQEGDGELKIHDNTAAKAGNAIYIEANSRHYLTIGGSLEIPKGQNDYHDIYIGGTSSTYYSHIEIANDLDGDFEATITPEKYIENIPLVSKASGASINLEAETHCFSVTPQTKDDEGNELTSPVNWEIDSTGKLVKSSGGSGGNGGGGSSTSWQGTVSNHDYVDLGLPSGTKWAKMNYGASSETAIGEKMLFGGNDIIGINWGIHWKMPNFTEITELYENCYFESVNSYNDVEKPTDETRLGYVVYLAKNENDKGKIVGFNADSSEIEGSYSLSDPHLFLPAIDYSVIRFWTNTIESESGGVKKLYSFNIEESYEPVGSRIASDNDVCWRAVLKNDEVLVTGGTALIDDHVGTVENDKDYNAGTLTIPDLMVSSNPVTQYEFEQYMRYYETAPSESSEEIKKECPVYYVSWIDAIIYCNLRSEKEGLTPVYALAGEKYITADNSPWTQYYKVVKDSNNKYYYNSDDYNDTSAFDPDAEVFSCDLSANGYRLPTTAEYTNILAKIPDLLDSDYNEWCQNYYRDYYRCWFKSSEKKPTTEEKYSISREVTLSFRVVRNAGANGGSNP